MTVFLTDGQGATFPLPQRIVMPFDSYAEVMLAVTLCAPIEVSAWGKYEMLSDGTCLLKDILFPCQQVSEGCAQVTPRQMHEMHKEIVGMGGEPNDYRVWIHSHPRSLLPQFSHIDKSFIRDQMRVMADWGGTRAILRPFV